MVATNGAGGLGTKNGRFRCIAAVRLRSGSSPCMYRPLFASVQLHVFWKSLICIRPVIGLSICRDSVGSTHAPLSH